MRAMSRRWAPGSERPHPMAGRSVRASGAAYLLASLAILFYLASGGASRACGSIRCTTAQARASLNSSLSGRFELAHFARFGAVTGFSRYAERVGFALSVTRRYKYALSSSDIAVCIGSASRSSCRFSSNQHLEPRRGQPVGALAASFWRRERKAEPTTKRSVLLSMRQGPV